MVKRRLWNTIWNILASSPSLPFPLLVARLVVSRDCSRFRGGALARIFFRVHLRSGYRMLAIAIAVFCGKTGRTGHALNITGPHWPRGPKRGGACCKQARGCGDSRSNSRSILLLQYRIRIKTFCATRIPSGCTNEPAISSK